MIKSIRPLPLLDGSLRSKIRTLPSSPAVAKMQSFCEFILSPYTGFLCNNFIINCPLQNSLIYFNSFLYKQLAAVRSLSGNQRRKQYAVYKLNFLNSVSFFTQHYCKLLDRLYLTIYDLSW